MNLPDVSPTTKNLYFVWSFGLTNFRNHAFRFSFLALLRFWQMINLKQKELIAIFE